MQENLNQYGSAVGLEFALDVTMEDELVAEPAVTTKWNNSDSPGELLQWNSS